MVIDPVCGMEVDEHKAKDTAMNRGTAYYFCSKDCKEQFVASPQDYIGNDDEEMTGT